MPKKKTTGKRPRSKIKIVVDKRKKSKVRAPAKAESIEKLFIPSPALKRLMFTLVGKTPLLMHNMDDKTIREIEDKYGSGRLEAKKSTAPITPREQYMRCFYNIPGRPGKFGIPVAGIKKAALSVCSTLGGGKTIYSSQVNKSFQIISNTGYLCEITKHSKPVMDEAKVRKGKGMNKVPGLAYRPRFDKWEVQVVVEYDEGSISASSILNLYQHAGFKIGLCDYRPEKGGPFGQFTIR